MSRAIMRDDTPELFDTSRIPDDSAHWDVRARQVTAKVVRESHRGGFEWLANSRRSWVVASLLLVVGLLSVVSWGEGLSARHPETELVKALAPADDVARAIILLDAPPPIEMLLLGKRGGV